MLASITSHHHERRVSRIKRVKEGETTKLRTQQEQQVNEDQNRIHKKEHAVSTIWAACWGRLRTLQNDRKF